MGIDVKDRVFETSTDTGLGDLTLGGAATGFVTFATVYDDSNDPAQTFPYVIENLSTGEFEIGTSYLVDSTTLKRNGTQTVVASSNANNPVNFDPGTKNVFSTIHSGLITEMLFKSRFFGTDGNLLSDPPQVLSGTEGLAIGQGARVAGDECVAIGTSRAGGIRTFAAMVGDNSDSYGCYGTDNVLLGYTSKIDGDTVQSVVLGVQHLMTEGSSSGILSGYGNVISGSGAGDFACCVAGGQDNQIVDSSVSFIGSGYQNSITDSAYASVIAGGDGNLIETDSYSVIVGGNDNTIHNSFDYNVIVGGILNEITGGDGCSIIGGYYNVVSNTGSHAKGVGALADKAFQDAWATPNGAGATVSGSGTSQYLISRRTTNNTPTELFCGGFTNMRLELNEDTVWMFEAYIAARRIDADNEGAAYKITGCIDRNGATTALVGTPVVTVIAEDTAGWDVSVSADDTNDALVFTVTGENSKTIQWIGFIRTVEVYEY